MEFVKIRKGGSKKNGKRKRKESSGKQRNNSVKGGISKNKKKRKPSSNDGKLSKTMEATNKQPNRKASTLSKLQNKFKQKLEGSQFRWLNEEMYTKTSGESFRMIQKNKALFEVYHKGFTAQVKKWPENPVDTIISFLQTLPKKVRIGDFGCGDARIARTLSREYPSIYSFDLAEANQHVTVCNIKKVPLKDNSLDIAIFCLSLMGVDFADFLKESNRVLRKGGTLVVAEVKSRFTQVEGDSQDLKRDKESMTAGIKSFVDLLADLGFKNTLVEKENQMFVLLHFRKVSGVRDKKMKDINFTFKSCRYKKR
mmetsp:Transcript_3121/g.3521  ORF Transcript_3121/g.3521 Transcript_3121/m.3521 type:complete len:311 (+) Transcript_3121:171-1103(+)|eukprot:CAMPEP_0184017932 /NCGR_PEP_ID=MMETSP0954-20121128/7837_1 /TAXON_ID=627963 /ORGANISM="Aplanochytrium sp, Strain PBS07" /LENGTH=310 /DNA_ID=CAMNT_0026299275 /DNA_START=157 /DNA_END=1089 /DNA_ORIENTATION=+